MLFLRAETENDWLGTKVTIETIDNECAKRFAITET